MQHASELSQGMGEGDDFLLKCFVLNWQCFRETPASPSNQNLQRVYTDMKLVLERVYLMLMFSQSCSNEAWHG